MFRRLLAQLVTADQLTHRDRAIRKCHTLLTMAKRQANPRDRITFLNYAASVRRGIPN